MEETNKQMKKFSNRIFKQSCFNNFIRDLGYQKLEEAKAESDAWIINESKKLKI